LAGSVGRKIASDLVLSEEEVTAQEKQANITRHGQETACNRAGKISVVYIGSGEIEGPVGARLCVAVGFGEGLASAIVGLKLTDPGAAIK